MLVVFVFLGSSILLKIEFRNTSIPRMYIVKRPKCSEDKGPDFTILLRKCDKIKINFAILLQIRFFLEFAAKLSLLEDLNLKLC